MVKELLGHSDISITLRLYAHVLPGMHQEAVEHLAACLSYTSRLAAVKIALTPLLLQQEELLKPAAKLGEVIGSPLR
ncbi:hypothetical protein EPA93_12470 [Ktedonosporobacter rubrisoli]|uniref:Tyr recombinase domain-containing protein n=1 Tax=Ktedonosporobacter rubrisoli TaxID=2509675 RepID=A0A4P6JNF9_KTERU|nr:hypothetical protein [Ktedonosporobacter rubrisoli]QBD76775.1 hypothetical protein EPA93_12470 [Ktedonosporobacter rubrisoli]